MGQQRDVELKMPSDAKCCEGLDEEFSRKCDKDGICDEGEIRCDRNDVCRCFEVPF